MNDQEEFMPERDVDARLEGEAAVTRSEEELRITTHRRETRRARLRKRVVTEMETRTVPVSREEVTLEYEPIPRGEDGQLSPGTDDAGAGAGAGWMVLYEEEVVLTTRRVAKERVRLVTHTVTEDREISEVLRKERLELGEQRSPG